MAIADSSQCSVMAPLLYMWNDSFTSFVAFWWRTVVRVNYQKCDCVKCYFPHYCPACTFPTMIALHPNIHTHLDPVQPYLRCKNVVFWQQQSEISRDRQGHNDDCLCAPLLKLNNDCVLVSPSSHYGSPAHSIDSRLFYFQVSFLMKAQFIHVEAEKRRKQGRDWVLQDWRRGNKKKWETK